MSGDPYTLTVPGQRSRARESRPAEPDVEHLAVSWTRAWDRLRELGFTSRAEVERAIGGWSNDPREVVTSAENARRRQPTGFVNLSRRYTPRLPPVQPPSPGARLECYGCGAPRVMGVPCEHCGALPVVARREEE